jgi:ribosome biogenesis GTPase
MSEVGKARVITVAGKRCRLELPDARRVEAIVRGKLFGDDRTNTLVVGDEVRVAEQGEMWTVEAVQPRRNEFVRQGLRRERQVLFANVDRVLIFASLANPATKAAAIDRFLVAALHGKISPALVLTKTDLDDAHEREGEMRGLYESFRLPVFPLSSQTGDGVDSVTDHIRHGVSAVVGNSGVGKSSLLNRLVPDLDLAVREVSAWSGKGTHTTSAALTVNYGDHAALIDTPGMKSFVPYGITTENLAELFPDIAELAHGCRFRNCRHVSEPDCAVLAAVDERQLAESRVRSYQRMLDEIEQEW